MKAARPLAIAVLVLLACGSLTARAQRPVDTNPSRGLPDFSGWNIVNRYTRTSSDRASVGAGCAARQTAIDLATKNADRGASEADEVSDPINAARAHGLMGQVCFYKGDLDSAISHFEASLRIGDEIATEFPDLATKVRQSLAVLGVAHLRRGEVENCALNHTGDMCLFPISPAGRHTAKSGSERAIEYFEKYLALDPANLEVRWLLNVAYQTLGLYPDRVPKQFLIPLAPFESRENIGRFVDVAPSLGLDVAGNAGGAIVDDFDNDGFFDVVESGVDPCQPLRMFRSNGDGTFTDVSVRSKLAEQLGGINCVQTDYDNDGWLDLFVMRGGWEFAMRNSLLRNNRDGTFTDVTMEAGLGGADHRTHSAAWADYDNDGRVDVFVGHEQTPSQLFRNKGDGTFEDVTAKAGVGRTAYTKGVVWGDYDGDGFPDLYASNYEGVNFLYRNKGDGTFEEVAGALGVDKPIRSFPTWFWDYDNDGRLDLFVASYTFETHEWLRPYIGLPRVEESMKLYRNAGKGTFTDVTAEVGLDRAVAVMGSNFGDLDNDGYLDFYLGTGTPSYAALMPNLMFRNHDGKRFVDVTTSTGTGHLQKGHGVAFADIDNDGDEDVYANIGGAVPGDKYNKVLFENPGQGNRWLSIKLVGVKTNRAAIGAKITVKLADGSIRYREVSSGGSFGASPLAQHIGVGKAAKIASVEVYWPASKTRQVFTDVAVDQTIEVKELDTTYAKRAIKAAPFKRSAGAPHHHATR